MRDVFLSLYRFGLHILDERSTREAVPPRCLLPEPSEAKEGNYDRSRELLVTGEQTTKE